MDPDGTDLEHDGEGEVIASLHVLGATVDQLREWISAMPDRGSLALRDRSPSAKWHFEGTIHASPEGLVSLHLHAREFGWLHEVAAIATRHGREAMVIDGESFHNDTGFRAFTVHTPGVAAKTWWIDPLRGLSAPQDETDDLLLKFVGDGHITQDEINELRVRRDETKLLIRLTVDKTPLWPPRFVTMAEYEREIEATNRLARLDAIARKRAIEAPIPPLRARPQSRPLQGLIALILLAPAAFIAPWFWSSLGQVTDVEGALIASACSVLSVGWLGLLPFGWLPRKWRVAWFVAWPVLVPLLWVLK